ncbi:MAG TPA: S41 family peptidase [Gemmatimonadales bacterium]|nr:S41 family peptidase [Gemmatimonadales bacterium]
MSRLSLKRAALALVVAAPLFLGGFIVGQAASGHGYRVFQAVFQIVSRDALDSVSTDQLYEHAARGIVTGIDDQYAELFSRADFERFNRNTLGNRYGGIGLRILRVGDWVTVYRVLPGGPAERAGVQRGDKIVAVNDSSARGWSSDRASGELTGVPGTPVRVTFERRDGQRYTVDLVRAVISASAVPFTTMLEGGVGYIPLQRFSDRSAADVMSAVQQLQRQGARSLVLDLRGNPGGSLEQAVSLTSVFLQPGQPVVTVRSRRGDDTLRASGPMVARATIPMAVLIDGLSASASEIVAGALQDYDRALVIGTTSFGKGLVQGAYQLPDGWVLRLTTAHWFTPSGRLIQRTRADSLSNAPRPEFRTAQGRRVLGGGGITPDIEVRGDTLTTLEASLGRILNQNFQTWTSVVDLYASELEPLAVEGYSVRPEWREELLRRLREAGVAIPDSLVAPTARYLERLLDTRIAGFALSDSAAFLRAVPRDRALGQATELLRRAGTQRELYALAAGRN